MASAGGSGRAAVGNYLSEYGLEKVAMMRSNQGSVISHQLLRACLKMRVSWDVPSLESRLQAVWACGRLKAGLQTVVFKQALRIASAATDY